MGYFVASERERKREYERMCARLVPGFGHSQAVAIFVAGTFRARTHRYTLVGYFGWGYVFGDELMSQRRFLFCLFYYF